jgi:hypothetical protein
MANPTFTGNRRQSHNRQALANKQQSHKGDPRTPARIQEQVEPYLQGKPPWRDKIPVKTPPIKAQSPLNNSHVVGHGFNIAIDEKATNNSKK